MIDSDFFINKLYDDSGKSEVRAALLDLIFAFYKSNNLTYNKAKYVYDNIDVSKIDTYVMVALLSRTFRIQNFKEHKQFLVKIKDVCRSNGESEERIHKLFKEF